jgi:hypothetical protein
MGNEEQVGLQEAPHLHDPKQNHSEELLGNLCSVLLMHFWNL